MGWRASDTRELLLEDAFVPESNRLGQEGDGFVNFMKTLDAGPDRNRRALVGHRGGSLRDRARLHAATKAVRKQDLRFQAVQFRLADMATGIQAAKHLTYHAAWLKDQGRPYSKEASMAKLYASELSMARHHRCDPAARWSGVYQQIPGGAHVSRRESLRDRRRHERDSAHADRALPGPGGMRGREYHEYHDRLTGPWSPCE